MRARRQRGSTLLVVVLGLGVLAVLALSLAQSAAQGSRDDQQLDQSLSARYLAEAGLTHARVVADSMACSGYALPATAFGGGSYQAQFNPNSGSPVSITVQGSAPGGVTTRLSRTAVPVFNTTNALPQRVLTSGNSEDSFIAPWAPFDDFSDSDRLVVTHGAHALLKMDLSDIPPSVTVLNAVLSLYQAEPSGVAQQIRARALDRDWQASEVGLYYADASTAWASPGGDLVPERFGVAVAPGNAGWMDLDVTRLVQQWVSGAIPNRGLMLRSSGTPGFSRFASTEADSEFRPRLTLRLGCECGLPETGGTLLLQPDASISRDVRLDPAAADRNFGKAAELWVGGGGYPEHASLLAFDLGALPLNARIDSAVLEVFGAPSAANLAEVGVFRVTRDWQQGVGGALGQVPASGATWNQNAAPDLWTSAGGDTAPLPAATFTVTADPPQWYSADITALVAGWYDARWANQGVLLRRTTGDLDRLVLESAEGAVNQPRLSIDYRCGCGACLTGTSAVTSVSAVASLDDAEEQAGSVDVADLVLDLVEPPGGAQQVGLRFPDLEVPQQALVVEARTRFTAAATDSGSANLTFRALASDSAVEFAPASNDISDRPLESGAATWNAPPWPSVDATHDSSDLAGLVQTVVDRPGWRPGNALGLVVTGSGQRQAWSADASTADAPQLTVAYAAGTGVLTPPGYRDEFALRTCDSAVDYAGSDGAIDWRADSWVENSESNGSCGGDISLQGNPTDGYEMRLKDDISIERALDLTLVPTPYLRLEYRREKWDGGEAMIVEAFSGVIGAWQEIWRDSTAVDDTANQTLLLSLEPFATSDARLRVRTEMNGNDRLYIDNVQVYPGDGSLIAPACDATFIDLFGSVDYAGSDGSLAWLGPWQEPDDNDDPASGRVRVTTDLTAPRVEIEHRQTLLRELDLTPFTTATLQFQWRRDSLDSGERLAVEVSNDGVSWTEVYSVDGPGTDSGYTGSGVISLDSVAGAPAYLRFNHLQTEGNDRTYIDDIAICASF